MRARITRYMSVRDTKRSGAVHAKVCTTHLEIGWLRFMRRTENGCWKLHWRSRFPATMTKLIGLCGRMGQSAGFTIEPFRLEMRQGRFTGSLELPKILRSANWRRGVWMLGTK